MHAKTIEEMSGGKENKLQVGGSFFSDGFLFVLFCLFISSAFLVAEQLYKQACVSVRLSVFL